MKYFLYFLANIAISIGIFYATLSKEKEYIEAVSTSQCFQQQAKTVFCAQCIQRTQQINLHSQKGFVVFSKDPYTILKQQENAKGRSCSQYLHIVDYKKSDKGMKIPFELFDSYQQEFQGKIKSNVVGTQIVSSSFDVFVIYRLFPLTQTKQTSVKYADVSQTTETINKLGNFINAIIAILVVIYFIKRDLFSHLNAAILFLIVIHYVVLEIFAYQLINRDICIKISRVLLPCIPLIMLQINKKVIFIAIVFGVTCAFSPLSYLVYLNLMFVLIFSKGMNEVRFKNIWTYLVLNLMVNTLNQFIQYFLLQELADTPCKFVELMFLVLTPTGILLIKDERQVKFELYRTSKRHTISLSGFEQQQDQQQHM